MGEALTEPDVFIIESLNVNDENAERFDGLLLAKLLKWAGKNPRYFYFEDVDELPHIMKIFDQTKCRFLHISCHGTTDSVITRRGIVDYNEFSSKLAKHLVLKRLFCSACELGNANFVTAISNNNKGMHSIVAPCNKIEFCHAATLWNAFYMAMFTNSKNTMTHKGISDALSKISSLFPIKLQLSTYNSVADKWGHEKIPRP